MIKYNEDSGEEDQLDDQVSLERNLVVDSLIEVDHLICNLVVT